MKASDIFIQAVNERCRKTGEDFNSSYLHCAQFSHKKEFDEMMATPTPKNYRPPKLDAIGQFRQQQAKKFISLVNERILTKGGSWKDNWKACRKEHPEVFANMEGTTPLPTDVAELANAGTVDHAASWRMSRWLNTPSRPNVATEGVQYRDPNFKFIHPQAKACLGLTSNCSEDDWEKALKNADKMPMSLASVCYDSLLASLTSMPLQFSASKAQSEIRMRYPQIVKAMSKSK